MHARWKATPLFMLVISACASKDKLTEPLAMERHIDPPHPVPRGTGVLQRPLPVDSALMRSMVVPFRKIGIPTSDGSGQAVHPSVVKCLGAAWMIMTPYRGGDAGYENPSILKASSDTVWKDAPGVKNPVMPVPPSGYNSDPDAYCDEVGGKLYVLYRVATNDSNVVKIFSYDGKRTDSTSVVLSGPSHDVVSPTFTIGADSVPTIYYVKTGKTGCSASSTSVVYVEATNWRTAKLLRSYKWSSEKKTDLAQLGWVVWHIEAHYDADLGRIPAFFVAYPKKAGGQAGACTASAALFLAMSGENKSHFTTYPQPIMWPQNPWLKVGSLYRASAEYDAGSGLMKVWPSYMAEYNVWWIGYFSFNWGDAIAALEQARADSGFASASYQRLLSAPVKLGPSIAP